MIGSNCAVFQPLLNLLVDLDMIGKPDALCLQVQTSVGLGCYMLIAAAALTFAGSQIVTRLAEAAIEEREARIKGTGSGGSGSVSQVRETVAEQFDMGGLGQLTIKALHHLCLACCVTRVVKKDGGASRSGGTQLLPAARASLTAAQLAQLDGGGGSLSPAVGGKQRLGSFDLLADTELLMQPSLRASTAAAGPLHTPTGGEEIETEQQPLALSSAGSAGSAGSELRTSASGSAVSSPPVNMRASLRENLLPEGEGWTLCTAGPEPYFWNSLTGDIKPAAETPTTPRGAGMLSSHAGRTGGEQEGEQEDEREGAREDGPNDDEDATTTDTLFDSTRAELNPLTPPGRAAKDGNISSRRFTDSFLGVAAGLLAPGDDDDSLSDTGSSPKSDVFRASYSANV